MTIQQALDQIDGLYPNHFEDALKISWLSELDGKIYHSVLLTHDKEVEEFTGYNLETDRDTELIVPYPYDKSVYMRYLEMMLHQEYKEIERYNQAATLFNSAFIEYESWYNRGTMPKSCGRFLF